MNNLRDNKMDEIKSFFHTRLGEIIDCDSGETAERMLRDAFHEGSSDLHHEIFNTDYYIIGTYKAKQWLGADAFDAIAMIKDYELDNFGEVYTDLSNPERVVNMAVYIIGEEVVADYVDSEPINISLDS